MHAIQNLALKIMEKQKLEIILCAESWSKNNFTACAYVPLGE
jgi:hypothetical protein